MGLLIANPTSAGSTKGLDEPKANGWKVVSMEDDWKTIFPAESKWGSNHGEEQQEAKLKTNLSAAKTNRSTDRANKPRTRI